jgi:hypothetical protein
VAPRLQMSSLSLLFFALLLCSSAKAQISCGDAPKDVPVSLQEVLKGDLEGKAQILSKLVGDAQIRGKIESTRNEIHQEHQNLDQYQLDMYFMWVACQTLNSDKLLSTQDKIKLWTDVLSTFNSRPSRSAITAPLREFSVQGGALVIEGLSIADTATDEQWKIFETKANQWSLNVLTWVSKNMAPSAWSQFLIIGIPRPTFVRNQHHILILAIQSQMKTISDLIESTNWDKP